MQQCNRMSKKIFKPLSSRPHLAREWHPDRNGSLDPRIVHVGSNLKVWWRCRVDPRHQWQAVVARRSTDGRGCPVCAGRAVGPRGENSLAQEAPSVARQWHPVKNGTLHPRDVLAGSQQRVWWKCPKGPDHQWQATVKKRARAGRGCPFCAGHRASITNSLAALRPEIARHWHPTRNGPLTPRDVTAHAHRVVWWRCRQCGRDWNCSIHDRYGPSSCPWCSHRRTPPEDSVAAVRPELARQWHPTRNGKLRPGDVVPGSNRRIWWKCPRGPDHEWSTTLAQRGVEDTGCPFCSRRRLSVTNHLATLFPDVARQWHPTRNGVLRPDMLMPHSKRAVWWKCKVAADHEWRAPVFYRTRLGKGCPCCAGRKLSVTNSLQARYPRIAAFWHPARNGRLTPHDVFSSSTSRVWWRCDRGHEWRAMPVARVKKQGGCPLCPPAHRRKSVRTHRTREHIRLRSGTVGGRTGC